MSGEQQVAVSGNDGTDQNVRYVDNLVNQNPGLIEFAAELHQKNLVPVSTYVLDLDTHVRNATAMQEEARRRNVTLYYMTKQIARNPIVAQAVLNTGFAGVTAVEPQEIRSLVRYGIKIGNAGHLANIPEHEIDYVLKVAKPEVITVFNFEKAKMISDRAERLDLPKQNLLIRPMGPADTLYPYMEGGVDENLVIEEMRKINDLPKARVEGITSFPCMLYDLKFGKPVLMANIETLSRVASNARKEGIEISQVNTPPMCLTNTIKIYASKGSTHMEPGLGVSGMAVWNIYDPKSNPEIPAGVHVTEVSHFFGDSAYVYGGGFNYIEIYELAYDGKSYIPPLSKSKLKAFAGRTPKELIRNPVEGEPYIGMIDYHAKFRRKPNVSIGDTVVFGFRTQMFVTRSQVAVVSGIKENSPRLLGLFDQGNNLIDRHGHLLGEEATMDLIRRNT